MYTLISLNAVYLFVLVFKEISNCNNIKHFLTIKNDDNSLIMNYFHKLFFWHLYLLRASQVHCITLLTFIKKNLF